ncbi:MAG: hypothetical protein ACKOU6_19780, partial [Planctomycetota bacterium]
MILNDQVTLAPDISDVFRYSFTGSFTPGRVQINWIAGSFSDLGPLSNAADSAEFVVVGPTATLSSPARDGLVGQNLFTQQNYVEVRFVAPAGAALDYATIDGDELTLRAPDGTNVARDTFMGMQRQGTSDRYRYYFTGNFDIGIYVISYVAGSWKDLLGNANLESEESFRLVALEAILSNPMAGDTIDSGVLNQRGSIDVKFTDPTGGVLSDSSITDSASEFTLAGTGTNNGNVFINGAGTKIRGEELLATDDVGAAYRTSLNSAVFSDALRTAFTNSNIKIGSSVSVTIQAAGSKWRITDENGRQYELELVAGSSVNQLHVYDFNYTYRYTYSGSFVSGKVTVNFIAGSWQNLAGVTNLIANRSFLIVSQAPRFEINVTGSVELQAGGFTPVYNGDGKPDALISLRGAATLAIEETPNQTRLTLDVSATLELIYLGNVGSAAGRFILVTGDVPGSGADDSIFGSNKLQFWGVLSVQTNLEKLRGAGINANATFLLYVKSTSVTKIETLRLEGIKGDQIFTLANSGISGQLPQDISPNSFQQNVPAALRQAFLNNG